MGQFKVAKDQKQEQELQVLNKWTDIDGNGISPEDIWLGIFGASPEYIAVRRRERQQEEEAYQAALEAERNLVVSLIKFCPFCGSTWFQESANLTDDWGAEWATYECTQCGGYFADLRKDLSL